MRRVLIDHQEHLMFTIERDFNNMVKEIDASNAKIGLLGSGSSIAKIGNAAETLYKKAIEDMVGLIKSMRSYPNCKIYRKSSINSELQCFVKCSDKIKVMLKTLVLKKMNKVDESCAEIISQKN